MKKILFITHTLSMGGGAEKVLKTLIGELKNDYKIDILEWLEDSVDPYKEKDSNIKYLGSISKSNRKAVSEGKNVKWNRFKHLCFVLINTFFPRLLYKSFIKEQYDYEISFNYMYTSALVGYSDNAKSKKIMWIHSSVEDLIEKNNSFKYKLYRWLQHRAFRKANAVIAISDLTYQSLITFDSTIKSRLHKIYNGYDFCDIRTKSQLKDIKQSNKIRLVTVGRLEHRKNITLQLQALEILNQKGIEIELYIVGIGEEEESIKKYAEKNLNIKLIGFQTNPYPYIRSSDALIITSFSEGFPTVAVEAMALGKPVISTPVAGTKELINEQTGVIVDWDPHRVAEGIIKLKETLYSPEIIKNHVEIYTKENWGNNIKNLLKKLDNESHV